MRGRWDKRPEQGESDVFNNKVIVQRCQWHKRENVVSYLPKNQQDAYNKDSYEKRKNLLRVFTD